MRSRSLAAALGVVLALASIAARSADDAKDYSPAERLIFMTDQLANVKPPARLRYSFRKSGALEEAFDDKVEIALAPQADGSCCLGHGEFLSGARQLQLPDVENAKGNPVIVYFLEHDVRDMHRLTKGQDAHFRRMIRMAIYKDAQVRDASLRYRGRDVPGKEVSIEPYTNDAQRDRFEKFARKRYVFLLSDEVPGGVYGIRSAISSQNADAPPLIVEELLIEGAEPAGPRS